MLRIPTEWEQSQVVQAESLFGVRLIIVGLRCEALGSIDLCGLVEEWTDRLRY